MRSLLNATMCCFVILLPNAANGQKSVAEVLMQATALRSTGQFDSALHLLMQWPGKDTLTVDASYEYLLMQTMTAVDARKGRTARESLTGLRAVLEQLPAGLRRNPVNELRYVEIMQRLRHAEEGCTTLSRIFRDGIPQDSVFRAHYLYLRGLCAMDGPADTVVSYYLAALDCLLRIGERDPWLESKVRRGLGITLRNLDPEASLAYHLREAEILESMFQPHHIETAGAYYNAANVCYELLDYAQALSLYQKAYPGFAARYEMDEPYMRFLHEAIGDMYRELGVQDSAVVYYDRSVIGEEVLDKDEGQRLNGIGDSLLSQGASGEALKYYRSALKFREEYFGPTHTLTGACNNFIGRVYMQRGQPEDAMHVYQRSLSGFCIEFNDTALTANPSADQIIRGTEMYVIEALMAKADGFVSRYKQDQSLPHLAFAHRTIQLCIQLIDRARAYPVADKSKMHWSDLAHPVYERALAIAFLFYQESGDATYLREAFSISEKSKAFTLLQALQFDAPGDRGLSRDILEREKGLRRSIQEYQGKILLEEKRCDAKREKKLTVWKDALDVAYNQYATFLRELKSGHPAYYALRYQMDIVSADDVQKSLEGGSVLLSMFYGENQLSCFAITQDTFIARSYKADTTLHGEVMHFTRLFRTPGTGDASERDEIARWSERCFQEYFADLLHACGMYDRIIVVSDGLFSYLPMELILSRGMSSAGRRTQSGAVAVSYMQSATLWAQAREAEPTRISRFTGIAPDYSGDPTGNARDHGWLKYNISEVEKLARLFEPSMVCATGISRDRFFALSKSTDILHLAMHAETDVDEPLLSSLLLYSGGGDESKVFAYDIQSMHLEASHVVLSACNTGTGVLRRGEGLMSLARCFQYAGCESLLVSLWPVDDLATSELMAHYYRHLLRGLPKDVALMQAKTDYLSTSDPVTAHPYYWAGFVLIGNTDPLEIRKRSALRPWMMVTCILILLVAGWYGYGRFRSDLSGKVFK